MAPSHQDDQPQRSPSILKISPNTVDVLIFAGTYFRGRLTPNQLAGINIRASQKPGNLRFCTQYYQRKFAENPR